MEKVLEVKKLKTIFKTEGVTIPAVNDVSFSLEAGKTLGIVGESGCGKSVTSLSIMQLVKCPPGEIAGGEILLNGKNLLELSEKEMQKVRGNDISMIFQEPMTSLDPCYTIGNQLMETITNHEKMSKADAKAKILDMLKTVSISRPETIYKSYPYELSGGMRQRVMIAMALLCNPQVLIADEPTTALDVTIQIQILDLIKKVQKESNTSVIMITHDLGVIAEVADHVIVMYAGRVVEDASCVELFDNPLHPYSIGLSESTPKIENNVERLTSIYGVVPNLANEISGCAFKTRCKDAMEICGKELPPMVKIDENHKVACWKYCNKQCSCQEGASDGCKAE